MTKTKKAGEKRYREGEEDGGQPIITITEAETLIMPVVDALTMLSTDITLAKANADLTHYLAKALRTTVDNFHKSDKREENRTRTHDVISNMIKRAGAISARMACIDNILDSLDKMRASEPRPDTTPLQECSTWTLEYVLKLMKLSTFHDKISKTIDVHLRQGEEFLAKKMSQKSVSDQRIHSMIAVITSAIRANVPTKYLADDPMVDGSLDLIMIGATATTTSPSKKQKPAAPGESVSSIIAKAVQCLRIVDIGGDPFYGERPLLEESLQKTRDISARINSSQFTTIWEDLLGLDSDDDSQVDPPSNAIRSLFNREYNNIIEMLHITVKPAWESNHTVEKFLASKWDTSDMRFLTTPEYAYHDEEQPTMAWEFICSNKLVIDTDSAPFSTYDELALFGRHRHRGILPPEIIERIQEEVIDSDTTVYTLVDMRLPETRRAVLAYLDLQTRHTGLDLFPRRVRAHFLTPLHCLLETIHCTDPSRVTPNHCLGALLSSRNHFDTHGPIKSGGAVNFYAGFEGDHHPEFFMGSQWIDSIRSIATEFEDTTGFDTVTVRKTTNSAITSSIAILGITPRSWIEGVSCVDPEVPRLHSVLSATMDALRDTFVTKYPTDDHLILVRPEGYGNLLGYMDKSKMSFLWGGDIVAEDGRDAIGDILIAERLVEFIGEGRMLFDKNPDTETARLTVAMTDGTIKVWPEMIPYRIFTYLVEHILLRPMENINHGGHSRGVPIPTEESIITKSSTYNHLLLKSVRGAFMWTSERYPFAPFTLVTQRLTAVVGVELIFRADFADDVSLPRESFDRLRMVEDLYGPNNLMNIPLATTWIPVVAIVKYNTIMIMSDYPTGGCIRQTHGIIDIMGILRLLIRMATHNAEALGALPINFLGHCYWIPDESRFLFDATAAWLSNDTGLSVAQARRDAGDTIPYILREICRQVREFCAVPHPCARNTPTCMNYGDMEFYRLFANISRGISGATDLVLLRSIVESDTLLLANFGKASRSILWSRVMRKYYNVLRKARQSPRQQQHKRFITVPAEFVDGTTHWEEGEGLRRVKMLLDILKTVGKAQEKTVEKNRQLFMAWTSFAIDYTSVVGQVDDTIKNQIVGASAGIGVARSVLNGFMVTINYMLRELTNGKLLDPNANGKPWEHTMAGAFFSFLMEAHLLGGVDTNLSMDFPYFPQDMDHPGWARYHWQLQNKADAGLIANNPCQDGRRDGDIVQVGVDDFWAFVDDEPQDHPYRPNTVSTYHVEASARSAIQYGLERGDWRMVRVMAYDHAMTRLMYSFHLEIFQTMPAYLIHRLICQSPPTVTADSILSILQFSNFHDQSHMPTVVRVWIQSLPTEDLVRFCFFTTGSRTILPSSKINIERARGADSNLDRLPVATTCNSSVYMPDYARLLAKSSGNVDEQAALAHFANKMELAMYQGAMLLG